MSLEAPSSAEEWASAVKQLAVEVKPSSVAEGFDDAWQSFIDQICSESSTQDVNCLAPVGYMSGPLASMAQWLSAQEKTSSYADQKEQFTLFFISAETPREYVPAPVVLNFETPSRKDWESAVSFFAASAKAAAEGKGDADTAAFHACFDTFIHDVVEESKTQEESGLAPTAYLRDPLLQMAEWVQGRMADPASQTYEAQKEAFTQFFIMAETPRQ